MTNWCVVGERCSGTKWLEGRLKNSLPDSRVNLTNKDPVQWKHGLWGEHQEQARLAHGVEVWFIFKDLPAWLLSLKRHPHHINGTKEQSFGQFIRSPISSVVTSPFLRKWYGASKPGEVFETYDNPVQMWMIKNHAWANIEGAHKISYHTLLERHRPVFPRLDYYLNREYLQEIHPEDLQWIETERLRQPVASL